MNTTVEKNKIPGGDSNPPVHEEQQSSIWQVIGASSVGTLIEWYDFYIFGSLATILSGQFFPKENPTAAFLSTLAAFAAGFIVRPFGALVFGRLGDIVGRKYTFLLTLILMGGSTFAIGLIPGYQTIGMFAPILVVLLRLVQGLALGGEYGGAATYVAEHSPANRRGYFTSWIQTTATLGLFISLAVIVFTRQSLGVESFTAWGWRIPFLVSALLVGVSIYIRLRMSESPLFNKIKKEGKISTNPLKESFGKRENFKLVLLALFGATMGQGVVWYTGQFYAMTFIETILKVEFVQVRNLIAIALIFGTPFFIVFGAWSDKVGRKFIMMAGMLFAILLYRPIYKQMYELANVKTKTEISDKSTINVSTAVSKETPGDSVRTTVTEKFYTDGTKEKLVKKEVLLATAGKEAPKPEIKKEVTLGSYSFWMMIFYVVIQVIFVTMVYGPIAAYLVEIFPTRIRYTSMSLPYHIGNGIFGGLTPFIATRLVDATKTEALPGGDPYQGLWYPIIIAAICFVCGMLFMSNKIDENVAD